MKSYAFVEEDDKTNIEEDKYKYDGNVILERGLLVVKVRSSGDFFECVSIHKNLIQDPISYRHFNYRVNLSRFMVLNDLMDSPNVYASNVKKNLDSNLSYQGVRVRMYSYAPVRTDLKLFLYEGSLSVDTKFAFEYSFNRRDVVNPFSISVNNGQEYCNTRMVKLNKETTELIQLMEDPYFVVMVKLKDENLNFVNYPTFVSVEMISVVDFINN